jgi:hypothetical protein
MSPHLSKMLILKRGFSSLLNELNTLNNCLSSQGIHPPKWHPWIQPFKKGEALIAQIDSKGETVQVSLLNPAEVAVLRRISPDFHNSFPGLNLNCPLFTVDGYALWNDFDQQWQAMLSLDGDTPLGYETKDLQRLKRVLWEFPQQDIAPRLQSGGAKTQAILALIQRLKTAVPNPERFLHQLGLQVVAAAKHGRIPRELALSVLFGKPNKKKLRLDAWQMTLILDIADLENFTYRVADSAAAQEWNDLLLQNDSNPPGACEPLAFICGLSGLPDSPVGKKMPSPNLPILGPSSLMSMNRDIPCQTRYGRTAMDIFPAGRKTILALNDSLLFVTAPSRQYKSWIGIPKPSKDESDLLVAYLEEDPTLDIPIAPLFGDIELSPGQELATYESRIEPIFAALRLMNKPDTDLHIRLLALSKIDKGRRQAVFSGRYDATTIFEAQTKWLSGAANVPEIAIPFPIAKGQKAALQTDYRPSPAEVMASFKKQWLRAGQTSQSIPGIELRLVFSLFLDADVQAQASWLLGRYMPLTLPLLIGLGRSLRGGPRISEPAKRESLIAIAVYGILLLRQGRTKEIYMEDRNYLIGQFLQLADLLHKLYCENERNNSIPPQLIGNAAITMAVQSPARAFSVLSSRMTIYLAWADRFKGENAGLAKWTRKELGRISTALKDQDLRPSVNNTGKAELLLGYLANFKPAQSKEN